MASTWSSGSGFPTFTAESGYFQEIKDLDSSFTFIDFLPECRNPGGIFSKPEYETFRVLVDRANDWLRANPKWQVKTCESVELTVRRDRVNPEKMVYLESDELATRYIRGLRLWITEKNGIENSQQIGYYNLIPQQQSKRGIFSSATYETLDDVVRRFNLMIRTNPLPGRIITIECQEMKMSCTKDEVDPDRSTWLEKGSMLKMFLFVIRIFFELSEGMPEEIGIMDFVPKEISQGGILALPKYELFSTAVEKASKWWATQQGIKMCNAQSLDIKVKRGHGVNTQNMSYTESGSMNTYYIRIVRIAYIKSYSQFEEPSFKIQKITCKTISPYQISHTMCVQEFESLQETKNRVSAWVKASGVQVISAETKAMRLYSGGEREHGTETSFTYNTTERNEHWIYVFRLYINGDYHEPPAQMLPPVPEIEYKNCCILS